MSINSIEDYELSYNLFLAEQEMFRELSGLSIDAITESTSLVALQEGVRETVMNYLQKIMTQIQTLWQKFQSNFASGAVKALEKKIEPALKKADDVSFTVNNFVQYDLSKMDTVKVIPFDYNNMKDDLDSADSFVSKYYSNLGGDIKKGLANMVATKVDSFPVNKETLTEMVNYFKGGYKEDVKSVEEAINQLNNSSKNITSMVSTVVNAQEAYNMLIGFGMISLNEADEEDPTKVKQTFTDDSGEKTGDSKENDEAKAKVTKAVTVYMTATTKILSAKMSMVNAKFMSYMNILTHFVKSFVDNKTAVVKDKIAAKKGTPTTAPQANIETK